MKNKNGLIWCNVWLVNVNKGKCVIATKTNDGSYKLFSNSSLMMDEPMWKTIEDRPGWFYRYANKDEITIFN